ncbi:hypothetical protein CP_0881 [Chlamydia pneumoniae AR39]|uniref:Uncharacterized protein n=3 Tax=Chlamydia pneumoniae TaxID=83558 RepID=Q9K1W1_CHLPN|nr:hypothetical protein CP_0881 [Chlamydia pneumoniae AR39]
MMRDFLHVTFGSWITGTFIKDIEFRKEEKNLFYLMIYFLKYINNL